MDSYSGTIKRSVTVQRPAKTVWNTLSNIAGLGWASGVKKTRYLSPRHRGVGAIREIHFDDGKIVEEHIVGWRPQKYVSYIAVSGLPFRAYHATISIRQKDDTSYITWQSYFSGKEMTDVEWSSFVESLGKFYSTSLRRLKRQLED